MHYQVREHEKYLAYLRTCYERIRLRVVSGFNNVNSLKEYESGTQTGPRVHDLLLLE